MDSPVFNPTKPRDVDTEDEMYWEEVDRYIDELLLKEWWERTHKEDACT